MSWECYVRLAYGFYGTLPAASHANLSLIGMYGIIPFLMLEFKMNHYYFAHIDFLP
jgi:hypothetical protein